MKQGRVKSSFLLAFVASVAVHATFMAAMGRYPVGNLPEWARSNSDQGREREMVAVLVPDPLDGPEAAKLAEPPPPPPAAGSEPKAVDSPEPNEPTPAQPKAPELNEFQVGDEKGTGYALHEVPGEQIPLAPKAENDQARLSRDPVGEFGQDLVSSPKAGGAPRRPEIEAAAGLQAAPASPAAPPPIVLVSPPAPVPVQPEIRRPVPAEPIAETKPPNESPKPAPLVVAPPDEAVAESEPGETEPPARDVRPLVRQAQRKAEPAMSLPSTVPALPKVPERREVVARADADFAPRVEPPKEEAAPRPPRRTQVAVLVPAASAPPAPRRLSGDEPGSSERAAGDPLPPSDSDSDAFSQLNGSAVLRQGRLEVQFGRKVKSRRPKFNTGGVVDLIYDQHGVDVVLSVATDASGKVTSVKVAKSSGSNAIDQPIVVSMYDWWFEPPKDKEGKPRPDQFKFTIGLR